MRIGFDIDDTLNNVRETSFRLFNEHFQTSIPYEEANRLGDIYFDCLFNLDRHQGKEVWDQLVHTIFATCQPLADAAAALTKLHEDGHDIFYLTAREDTPAFRSLTKNWLKEHGFPFDARHFFIGMGDEGKAELAEKLQLDLFFEDKPHIVLSLIQKGIPVVMKKQCYNEHLPYPALCYWHEVDSFLKKK